jgi:hypothetical protein
MGHINCSFTEGRLASYEFNLVNRTRQDKVRNEDSRNSTVIPQYIERRLKWFGHLVRMQHDYQQPRLTIAISQDKDQKEDQENDGSTVLKKHLQTELKYQRCNYPSVERKLLLMLSGTSER